jgi:stage II sporulation protein D
MRRALQTALTAVLVGAALGLPSDAADADTALPIPSTGTLTLSGHGFGHGHGMSQYGAQGAARQGKGWSAIVGFYYPGTAQAKLARDVRVLISGDTSDELDVSAQTGLIVINTSNNTTAAIPANGADRWRLGVAGARTTVWFRKDGTWTYWRSFPGDGAFRAGGAAMTLWYGSGAHHYRGTLVQSLISQMTAPLVTVAPTSARGPVTVPALCALSGCSIFIASRTTTTSPSATSGPPRRRP